MPDQDTFVLPGSASTPRVDFHPALGRFLVQGVSHPENANEFYGPVVTWLEAFTKRALTGQADCKEKLRLTFLFRFLNTASLKAIGRICLLFSSLQDRFECTIEWLYEPNDMDVRDVGEDVFSLLNLSLPVHVKEVSNPIDLHQ